MSTPNPVALTYNSYITQIYLLAGYAISQLTTTNGVVAGDANFTAAVPQMINYAELRIQRDLDLLPSQTSSTAYSFQAGSNMLSISVNDFVTVQTLGVAVSNGPLTSTSPLTPATKEFIQTMYPDNTSEGVPKYFAPYGGDQSTGGNTSNIFIVGPWPVSNYAATVTGTARLPSLNSLATSAQAASGSTFISTNLADLLIMASMVYLSAYQRNFGRQNDDPQMAVSYEGQYQALLAGAKGEEFRKKYEAAGWTAEPTSPVATPNRQQ